MIITDQKERILTGTVSYSYNYNFKEVCCLLEEEGGLNELIPNMVDEFMTVLNCTVRLFIEEGYIIN